MAKIDRSRSRPERTPLCHVPGIHDFTLRPYRKVLDARDKPGHDTEAGWGLFRILPVEFSNL
jgi:hypothetical protein